MAKLIILFEITFNFLFIIRNSERLRRKNLISEVSMTKIVAAFCIWILVWAIVPNFEWRFFSFMLWLPAVMICFCPAFLKHVRKKQFRTELRQLLNNIILKMRGGRSFRAALQSASQDLSAFTRAKIEKTLELMTIDPNNVAKTPHDPEIEMVLMQFRAVEADSHQALPRLCQFREKLRTEDNLKKKIEQALNQVRAQAWILTALYVGLLILIISKYQHPNVKFIFISVLLFLAGLISTIWQGRRFKWKV